MKISLMLKEFEIEGYQVHIENMENKCLEKSRMLRCYVYVCCEKRAGKKKGEIHIIECPEKEKKELTTEVQKISIKKKDENNSRIPSPCKA